jgi:hypothetical protein
VARDDHGRGLGATRRELLAGGGLGLGALALQSLFGRTAGAAQLDGLPHHAPRAKRVVHLFMAGGPSQLELYDPKPELERLDGQVVPPSFVEGKRFAFIGPDAKLMASRRRFQRYGDCGMELGELLPHIGGIADRICLLRAVATDQINHGPAKLFWNTGSAQFGRPSLGAWLSYGLGSDSDDLPAFVVMQSGPRGPRGGSLLWSSGFLPPSHQGVPLRNGKDPILHLASPDGFDAGRQRAFHDAVRELDEAHLGEVGDPEIQARIEAYELAARMQTSAPELVDLTGESAETLALYGCEPERPSFARNCLYARRLLERGVRFVQLYHTDWDHHGDPNNHLGQPLDDVCAQVDRPSAALVTDLARRGLLDDTLVIWSGEFGRTPMSEVRDRIGRDHHIDAYSMWMAGAGLPAGHVHGATDDIGYAPVGGRVHVHDLMATVLHLLGIDHTRFTYRSQGRDFRLTDVAGEVVGELVG